MKIKTALVQRDQSGAIVSESSLPKHAVVVDESTDKSEIVPTDTVEIEGILFKRTEGIFQVELALGGYDSSGNFHRNLKYQPALISLMRDRQQDAKIWNERDLDNFLKPLEDDLKSWLQQAQGIDTVAQAVWHVAQLESKLLDDKGSVVADYKRGSVPAVKPAPVQPISPPLGPT